MASQRYACENCDKILNIENRKRNKVCPHCGSWCSRIYGVTVVNKTLTNGSPDYRADKLTIEEGVTSIDGDAFKGSDIGSIEFPKSLKELPSECFANCRSLKKLTIPGTIKDIGSFAFRGCPDLEEVIISEGVKEISSFAFDGCEKLRKVVFPKSLKKIGSRAFYNCSSLEEVILPNGIETIEKSAFSGCGKLIYISLPGTIKKLGAHAFLTPSVNVVILPSKIEEFGESVFESSHKGGKGKQHIKYFVSKGSGAESYLKSEGLTYSILKSTTGYAVGTEVYNKTLYYLEQVDNKTKIPEKVCSIAEYAFWDRKDLVEVIIPSTVTDIGASAFQGCDNLSVLTFAENSNLQKIGSKAFASFAGKIAQLPASVAELAGDAFPKGCIVSVGGEMPYYVSKLSELNEQMITTATTIDANKKRIADLEIQLEEAKARLEEHIASLPSKFDEIPGLREEIKQIEESHDAECSFNNDEMNSLNERIAEVESKIEQLQAERKACFFLAFAKKREIDEDMAHRQSELQSMRDDLQKLSDKSLDDEKKFADLITPMQRDLDALLDEQKMWNDNKTSLTRARDDIEAEIKSLSVENTKLAEKYKKDESALSKKHEKWIKAKEQILQQIEKEKQEAEELNARQRLEDERQRLEDEKKKIISGISIPICSEIPLFEYTPGKAVFDERLLNEALLRMITDLNKEKRATTHNRYIEANSSKIERVKEINALLGYEAEHGIAGYAPLPVPEIADTYIPERVSVLSKCFVKSEYWSRLKHAAIDIRKKKNVNANIHDKFFQGLDYFAFEHEGRYLLMLPYCMVIYVSKKPMAVLTYNKANFAVKYTDKEEIGDDIPPFGELIHERHRHINADGSVSRRYKDNPIIKTIRYTTVTIKAGKDRFTFPTKTQDMAMQLENAFNSYCKALTTGLAGNVYSLVASSGEQDEIIAAFDDLAKEKARLRELEKQREEEEKRRLEEERIAAEKLAEERKKAIIQRQRELNEERKREAERLAEERRRVEKLFGDDLESDTANVVIEKSDNATCPVQIIGNRLITNNIFKVTLKFVEGFRAESLIAYFVTDSGETISNKKKILVTTDDVTIGFVLNSGIDYTTMQQCLMRFESQGDVLPDIDFKMNISFYSDF